MKTFIAEGNLKTRLPKWLRTSFIDDDGTLFLPCAMFHNERASFLCMSFDGAPMVMDANHVYAPVWWLEQEYPKLKEEIQMISNKILSAMRTAT
jgi:hypothetical protein